MQVAARRLEILQRGSWCVALLQLCLWVLTITDAHHSCLSLFHPAGLFEVQTMGVSEIE